VAVSRPSVELHIEQLVLRGFSPGDKHAIAAALESELVRLLTEKTPAPLLGNRSVAAAPAKPLTTTEGARPESVGQHLGRSVYGVLEDLR
jgi:hypothetical protein